MNLLLRLGWRDLSRNRRFTLLFLLNLALGLTGFLLIGSFTASLSRHFDAHLRELLTADLVLHAARPLTASEIETSRMIAGPAARFSDQISFYTMIKGTAGSKLTQIVAIDPSYPLYGAFRYPGTLAHTAVIDGLQGQRKLLMSRETAWSLGLAQGDSLTIGQAAFEVAYFFDRDPDSEITGLALAPKIYLGLPQLQDSGLIRFGSRIAYKRFLRLPESADPAQVTARLTQALAPASGQTPDIRVEGTRDINRRLGRVAGYFSTFLGFAAMVSLFLSGLSAAYLFREHLRAGMKETAILLSLGASRSQCLALAVGQLVLLGSAAACLSILFTWLLLPFFGRLLTGIIPPGLHPAVDPASALILVLVGAIGSLLFCLPVFLQTFSGRPLSLLQENREQHPAMGRKFFFLFALSLLPGLVLLLLLAIRLSRSPIQGAMFTAGLIGLLLVFSLLAVLLAAGCRRWSRTSNLTWRIIWRNLHRNRLPAGAVFVALATALSLVNLVPQLEKGLAEEIGQPAGLERPDLFLIDIQEEQRQPLQSFFGDNGPILSALAPMVRGRIVSVNAVPFGKWRQQHGGLERDFRRTEFNFSNRDTLDASEKVVAGPPMREVPWSPDSNQPFEISMEQRFSERLGVGIGDRMVFDIQGIELEGRIVNLRQVRWNSFQPNFFLLLQKGVLDEAPKTYLASVSRAGEKGRQELVNRLTARFPNISVIDVTRTVEQLTGIAEQLTRSLRFMAALAMATGLAVVISIARQEALRREREINLLRVLGAGAGRIRRLIMLEFAFLGVTAALAANLLSSGCSLAIAWLLFDRIWRFQWQSGLLLLAATSMVCAVVALLAADSVIRRKPSALLG